MPVLTTDDFPGTIFEILEEYSGKPCNLMIAGGSLLAILNNPAYKSLDTRRWQIFYADERCDQAHLNYDGSRPFLSLLSAKSHPIRKQLGKQAAANEYRNLLDRAGEMDICLLGIGDNGHICSLWPESEGLADEKSVVGADVDSDVSPQRVTITIAYINNSIRRLYFVLPPKNGVRKRVTEPEESIRSRIKIEYTTILPK